MKKLGIIQGRLSEPVNGHIQEFPVDNWQKEFEILETLKLSHIEWIITPNSLNINPAFNQTNLLSKYPINTICCDHLIDERIDQFDFLKENLEPVCVSARLNGIKTIGIPLLEKSSLEDKTKRLKFADNIQRIYDRYSDLTFSFEAELTSEQILEILELNDGFKLTYDTGNITSHCGVTSHLSYLKNVFHKIDNVHLKDRRKFSDGWKTVFPTTGETNFYLIFEFLKQNSYGKRYTMQTARGLAGLEYQTISYHKLIFEELYERV